jgi:hypothetical protein
MLPGAARELFGGKRIYIWLTVPFIYTSFFWIFQTPVVFNIKHHSWHFDPYLGTQGFEGNQAVYLSLRKCQIQIP